MRITGAVLEESGRGGPFARTGPLTVCELELAPPGPTELLVRIEVAGVCHSDLSVVSGDRPRPTPMLLGHEAAGIAEAVGRDVRDVAEGDRVVLTFLPRCGACAACATDGRLPCEPGSAANARGELLAGGTRLSRGGEPVAHHLGASAFATHAVVDRRSVVPVSSSVPPEVAALLGCAVLTGGGALLNASGARDGDPVIVVGLGGVGTAALLVAKATGHPVVAVDALPGKRALALAAGADAACAPDELDGRTAPVVIEAAGHPRAFETAFAATAPGGTTVTVGLPRADARSSIAPLLLTSESRTVVGSYLGSSVPARDVPRYAALWQEGRLPVERLVSGHLPLTSINEAMDALAAGTALRLAAQGRAVGVVDLAEEATADAVAAVRAAGGRAIGIGADVSRTADVEAAVARVADELGPPTILVNNAGILRDNLIFKMSDDDWDSVVAVHLRGAFLMSRAVQQHQVRAKWGRIVSLSSTSALGNRGQVNYAAVKAGLQGLTKTLSIELGRYGVTANAVAPGFIATEMLRSTAERMKVSYEQFLDGAAREIPVQRVGQAEDVAEAIAFFTSDAASFVSGQVLYVAGGPKA